MTRYDRYKVGGDLYALYEAKYGWIAAQQINIAAIKAEEQDYPGLLTEAIAIVRNGPMLPTSTASIFVSQVINDPLAAPLDALDKGVKQIFDSEGVKSIVVIAVVGLVAAIMIHGALKS